MRVYYAHCLSLYGTPQETRDILLLERAFADQDHGMGGGLATVVSPSDPAIEDQCAKVREAHRLYYETGVQACDDPLVDAIAKGGYKFNEASAAVMDLVFKPIVENCHVLAFRALPDGYVPAGVAKEIAWARAADLPVLEIPNRVQARTLSVELTREYLREVGQR